MSRALSALLLHGAGGGGWEWDRWRALWDAEGVAVRAPDLAPRASLADTVLADYLAQAAGALRALPRPRVAVGASLGGLVAAAVAGEADALVLVNPLPPAPWTRELPAREWPAVVPWRAQARLTSTRRALPDADEATALWAFRRWRDESGAVLREAHGGIAIERPPCPVLCLASLEDEDLPLGVQEPFAAAWSADLVRVPGSHVGPLLGRQAAACARLALAWVYARMGVGAMAADAQAPLALGVGEGMG